MSDIFASPFFGITISILAFFIGLEIQKRTRIALCNPLLLAIILVIVFLKIFGIPYDDYNEGGAIINMFLAPATACLAVSMPSFRFPEDPKAIRDAVLEGALEISRQLGYMG